MALSFLRPRLRGASSFGFRALALAALLWPATAFADPVAAVEVNVDQAKLVKLPDRVATIVVVTGKGYGATNFIAMDRSGQILMDQQIQVSGPTDQLVTVYRGVDRETYSCMPVCQKRVTLGDADGYFKQVMDQAGSLSGQVSGSAAAKTN
jgi:hypothetical protein